MARWMLLIGLALLVTACDEKIDPGRSAAEPVVIRGLATAVVASDPVLGRLALVGSVESPDRAELEARIAGRIEQVLVREGAEVAAGQPLVRLTDQTVTAGLNAARAAVTAAGQARDGARAELALAEQTLQRYQRLQQGGAVTPQEFDQVSTARQLAASGLAVAEARLAQAESELAAARIAAAQAELTAPYAARVSRVLREAGSTVQPGTPLLRLDRLGPWRVRVAVPEQQAGRLAVGMPLTVEIPALGLVVPAQVRELLPLADPQSRSIEAKLGLETTAELTPGLFARVLLEDPGPPSLSVPAAAVVTRGQLTGVYVVEAGRLSYRLVRTGDANAGRIEILAGLDAGEQVVSAGVERARHGARLEP